MTSQQWTERRESRKQCTPPFTWNEYRYSVRKFMLESAPVRQILINYIVWIHAQTQAMQEQIRIEQAQSG